MGTNVLTPGKIVSVSEFSQGKAGKVFNDVGTNKNSYVVMKNNTPVAVIVSIEEYNTYQDRIEALEAKLAAYINVPAKRIGVAQASFDVPDDFDDWDIGFGDDDEDLT